MGEPVDIELGIDLTDKAVVDELLAMIDELKPWLIAAGFHCGLAIHGRRSRTSRLHRAMARRSFAS